MSRHPLGPRLYLRKGRIDSRSGRPLPDLYFIRDGQVQVGTGFGPGGLPDAERALAAYIAEKWTPQARSAVSRSDPAEILIAEVLALYAKERAPKLGRDASTTATFIQHLLSWWGERTLADVRRSSCQDYVAFRQTQPDARYKDPAEAPRVSAETARCELETLSAAIGYWDGEDKIIGRPTVWLPDKGESQREALSRSQAAALLRAAMGWRRDEDGHWTRLGASARANRAHLRRFILIGLYSGTRHTAMRQLLWQEATLQAWVDLDAGMIYRRGAREKEHRTKRRPVVKIPRRLLAHMKRWRRIDGAAETARREAMEDPRDYQPLRTTVLHHGGYALAGKIRTGFAGCVADAGLPAEITPHWMRHTCATWLMEAGVDLWDAAAFTGMTTTVLEDHYGHHRPGYQAAAAKAVGGRR